MPGRGQRHTKESRYGTFAHARPHVKACHGIHQVHSASKDDSAESQAAARQFKF